MSDNKDKRIHSAYRLDEKIMKDFKVILVKKGESAQKVIEDFILNYINENKKLL